MFYSQFILAKKGPLGTIWIAAHLERKLRKNQVADTDIGVSVDSILFPEMPIALRLSSHLLLGVVRIYSKKVNYLFDDCSEALLKVKQAFRSTAVDLPPEESTAPYHSITLPETFDLDDFELPDSEIFQGNYVDHHVSSKDQITLQDTMEGVVYSTSNFGLDERFGDDDAGMDLDEELLVEKAAPSEAATGTANSNVDPQASIQANVSLKSEDHHDAPTVPQAMPDTGNENQHAEEYDGDNEPVDYAQAPCTPGLWEPNLSNIQETSACDEHQEPENHIITESAVKENQENAYTKEAEALPHDHLEPENHIITESAVKENLENAYTKEAECLPHEQHDNQFEPLEKSPPLIATTEQMQVDDLGSTPFTGSDDHVRSMSSIPEVSQTVISVAHDPGIVEGSLNKNIRDEEPGVQIADDNRGNYVEHQGIANDIYSGNQENAFHQTSELELNTEPSGKDNLGSTQDQDQAFLHKDSMITVQTSYDSMPSSGFPTPCVTFPNHESMSNDVTRVGNQENAFHPTSGLELNTEPSGKKNLLGPQDQAFPQPKDSMITVRTHDSMPSSGFPTIRPCVTFQSHQGMPDDISHVGNQENAFHLTGGLELNTEPSNVGGPQDQAFLQPKDSMITVQSHHDSMPSSDFQSMRPYVSPVNHLGNQENAFHLTSGLELNSEPSGNDNIRHTQGQGFVQPKDSMITFHSAHDSMPSSDFPTSRPSVMLPNHDGMKFADSHQPSDFSSMHSLQMFGREENLNALGAPILMQGEVPSHATVTLERNLPETFHGELGPSDGVQVAPTPIISNRHVENVIEREVQVDNNINTYTPYYPAPEKQQLSLPHWLSDAPKDLPLESTPAGKAMTPGELVPSAEVQAASSLPNRHMENVIHREAQVDHIISYPPSAEVQVAPGMPNRQVEYAIQRAAQIGNINSYPPSADFRVTSSISNRHVEYETQREAQVENINFYPPSAEVQLASSISNRQVASSIPSRHMENVIQREAQVDHVISYPPRAEVQVTSSISNKQVENVIQREAQVDNIISYPPPEKQLSLPHWLSDVPKELIPESTPARQDIAPGYGGNNMHSGRKRSFTETTMTAQSLNLNESSSLFSTSTATQTLSFNQSSTPFTTTTTKQSVPRDNDMLSSILVGRNTSMLKVKHTPPVVVAPSAKRQRRTTPKTGVPKTGVTKRKVLMDDTMVLHGDTIRQQLTNTEDIRRLRKKAPCTHSEISMIEKQFWEDELFGQPIFTGVSTKLASLHRQLYDLSKIAVSHPDASVGGPPEQRSISHNHEKDIQPQVGTKNAGVNPNGPKENRNQDNFDPVARKDVSETQPIDISSVTDNHTYDNNTESLDYYGSQEQVHATRDVNELFGSEHDVLEHGKAMEIDDRNVTDADVGVSVMPTEVDSLPHANVVPSDSNDTSAALGGVGKTSQMDASLEAGPPGFQKMGLQSADMDSNVVSNDTSAAVGEVGKTSRMDASLEAGPPGFQKMGLQSADKDSNVVSNDTSGAVGEVGKTSQMDASLQAGPPGFQKMGLQSADMDPNEVSSDANDTSAALGGVAKTGQMDASLEAGPPGFQKYEKTGLQSGAMDSNAVSSDTNDMSAAVVETGPPGFQSYEKRVLQSDMDSNVVSSDTSAALGEVGKTSQMDASLPTVPPGFGSFEKTGLQSGDMDPNVVPSDANDTSAAVVEVEKTNQMDASLPLVPPGFGSFQKTGLQSADVDPNVVSNDMSAAVGEVENTSQMDASLPMVPPGFGSYEKPVDMVPNVVTSDTTNTSAAQAEVEKTSQTDASLPMVPPGFHPNERRDLQSADMDPPSTNEPIETSISPEIELDDASLKETPEEKHKLAATTSTPDVSRSDINTLDQDTEIRNNEEEKDEHNLVSNGICDEEFAAHNAEVNSVLEDALSDKRETPVLQVPFPMTTIDLEDNPSDNMDDDYDNNDDDYDDDDNDVMYTGVGNDTDFLNLDDVDDDEAQAADDHMPDGEATKILDNSGWSSRTRAVAKYLQIMFDKEGERGRNTLGVNNMLAGKTRKEASRMFFETLVLKTKDYIHVEQTDPFENINVFPRAKLLKSEF